MTDVRLASVSTVSKVTSLSEGCGSHGNEPPAFVLPPRNARVTLGGEAQLEGKVRGHPEPQVTWYREGRAVIGGEHYIVERSGRGNFSLLVRGVTEEDLGSYTCQATNQAGSRQVTVEILLEENSGKKYVVRSSMKAGCRSAAPAVENRPSIWSESPPKFINKLSRVFAELGQSAKFTTKTTGRPQPRVTWYKGEAELQSGGRVSMYERSGLHFLEIKDVIVQDAGSYTCSISNGSGMATASAELTVQGETANQSRSAHYHVHFQVCLGSPVCFRPVRMSTAGSNLRFEAVPLDQEATEGAQVMFTCQVSSSAAGAVDTWLKDGGPVRTGLGLRQRRDDTRLTLTLERVRRVDQGTYRCQLTTADGLTVDSAAWTLLVHSEFLLTQTKGQFRQSGRQRGGRSGVTEVRAACEAPRFIGRLSDLKVMDGSRVAMTVELSGHPPPEVVWLHNGQEVTESEDFQLLREGTRCTLLIHEVFPEDTGTYSCQAWNQYGEDQTQARLTVEEPQDGVQPWFITKPKEVSAAVGQHVLLSCAIAGDPFPQYTWTRADTSRPVTSGGDYELLQKEDVVSLLIRRVKKEHAGEYLIRLRNSVGECSAVATLSVTEGREKDRRGRDGSSRQWQEANEEQKENRQLPHLHREEKKKKEEDQTTAPRGLLKRCVETRERGEEELRQREAQQLDFRSLLGRRAVQGKNIQEGDEPREAGPATATAEHNQRHHMDFKANLKGVKPKSEEKVNSPSQVDFRSVLGKKGAASSNSSKAAETPTKNAGDFRSVLANKKKPTAPEKNGEKAEVNNCVDGGINEKKSTGGGEGGGGGAAPEFVEKLSDMTVLDGQRLRLQCRLATASDVTVTWTLDGKVIKASKFIVLANEGGLCSLTIDKALLEDEGQYKCRAENSAGKAECSCTVLVDDHSSSCPNVWFRCLTACCVLLSGEARIKKPTPKTPPKQALPPQILQFPEDMKILAGEKVEILCKFSGAPPITCTWLKFRKPIQEGSDDISIESNDSSSRLTIGSGQQEHCGCYTIELKNSYGLRQAALNLTIVDKPDPPAKVPAASDIRRSSLTLSWYGPTYDGGSAVQSYKLEIWDSMEQQWKHLVSCNSTSYNVQNLLPDRQYKFRVRAENVYGVGEPSAESEPVTVGLVDDDDSEKEPEYRDVTIRTDIKVKDLYDVEERLGTGKFGQVFKLVEKSTKKVWAGKFIKAYSAKEKENVRQEIGIMNSLHHPKLVQCVDAFEGKSDIVMVLEMISGGELFERIIDEDFELTEREVIKYMLQIIDGVNFIHKQGIVHLDLKPENIMCINKTGSKIKLIDFGLARRLENAGTLKVLFGTPEFVAPEVINYEPISYPTDMWSIGVICYILLSGLSPFMGDNDNETLSNVTSATWDFEDEAFDEISDNAKDFITKLLKKDMK
uniref:Myosin light chain kinase, smooth muscle n=1 Tax=Oreochromis niloticus TaxID=8128 RepID=A0A669B5X8_ORENI